jgi:transcriptional regulator with XRE-family HTH domain
MASLRACGLSLKAIGELLGVSRQSVHATLKNMALASSIPCGDCKRPIEMARADRGEREVALCLSCLANRPDAPSGQRLKALRLAAGLTKHGLARRAGVDAFALLQYESGRRMPKLGSLGRLATALGVSADALILSDETEQVANKRARGRPRKLAAAKPALKKLRGRPRKQN